VTFDENYCGGCVPFPELLGELDGLLMLPELLELPLILHVSEIMSTLVTLNVFPDSMLPDEEDAAEAEEEDPPFSHVPLTETS
jgi:hypothetical protein